MKTALIAAAAVTRAVVFAGSSAGCVDERNIPLPTFAPNAAVLLVVQGVHPAVVHAFQADAEGHARLPAFSASEEDTIALGEYACTLGALQIDAGWHATEPSTDERSGRPLPLDPVRTYRLNGDTFEDGPLPDHIKLLGAAPTGCVELTPTYEVLLDFDGAVEVPVAVALHDDDVLIQPLGFWNELDRSAAFRVRRDQGAERIPAFPDFTRGAYASGESLWLVDSGGTVYSGGIDGPFTRTATLSTEYLFNAWIDRAPGTDRFFIATTRPGLYQLDYHPDGSRVTSLYKDAPVCTDGCEEGGVLAISENEAYAVLTGEVQVLHAVNGAVDREPLDRNGFHTPTRLASWKAREPLVGSHFGGIFARVNGRWGVLAASLTRDINFVLAIPGGILFSQNRAVVAEYQLDAMALCPPIELETNDIFTLFMAGETLVIVDRTPEQRVRVSFNALRRRFNRCDGNTP